MTELFQDSPPSRSGIVDFLNNHDLKVLCEVGVYIGEFTNQLLKSNATEVYAVDTWAISPLYQLWNTQADFDLMYQRMLERAEKDKRLKPIRGTSSWASTRFIDGFFDMVYLDADHTYAAVESDLRLWWDKVKPGGILCGHDYMKYSITYAGGVSEFGVVEAVSSFVRSGRGISDFYVSVEDTPSWFIRKG
jgi:hypothetical protein